MQVSHGCTPSNSLRIQACAWNHQHSTEVLECYVLTCVGHTYVALLHVLHHSTRMLMHSLLKHCQMPHGGTAMRTVPGAF